MKDFETKLGLDDGYYPYWETGIFPPTIDFLISIAQFFRVSLDYLLGLTDESGQGQAAAKDGPVT
jgi:transcriptional regulator with XRE-family HTH domain